MRLAAFVGTAILALPCVSAAQDLSPGDIFVDCEDVCPQMVVIPAGVHLYGPPLNDDGSARQRSLATFSRPFAIGRFEITFDEWDACVADGGCRAPRLAQTGAEWDACRSRDGCSSHPDAIAGIPGADEGWGRGRRPAINLSRDDAELYLAWLSERTGQTYRLPSLAEWSYAGAGGSEWSIPFAGRWQDQANLGYDVGRTLPVGAYSANSFGLHDMLGNVSEFVAGCVDYYRVPSDGTALAEGDCPGLLMVGGSWAQRSVDVIWQRPWSYGRRVATARTYGDGFRVARDL